MDRRSFVKVLGAAGVMKLAKLDAAAQAAAAGLKGIAEEKGLVFGSCLALKYFAQVAAYKDLFVTQCDIATPEIHMKWDSLSGRPGSYGFNVADQFVDFCQSNRIKIRGHALVDHGSLPKYVTEMVTPDNGRSMMLDHIQKVASHYAGKLYSWDVVNEALDPASKRKDGLRDSIWLKSVGPDFIEQAFRATAAIDPRVLLIWNDNHLEQSNEVGIFKRKSMLNYIDNMLSHGVRIDGVGLQAHLKGEEADIIADSAYEGFLADLARLKMKIYITELDVADAAFPGDVGQRDKAVADLYHKIVSVSLRQQAVKGVVTWGLSDAVTWIKNFRPRADGLPVRPLPFDENCQPTPAYYALADALRTAVPRRN